MTATVRKPDGEVITIGAPGKPAEPVKSARLRQTRAGHLCKCHRRDRHYGCPDRKWFYRVAIASGDGMIVAGRLVLRSRPC